MKAVDFLNSKGFKNITKVEIFSWIYKDKKYMSTPYAPDVEYIASVDRHGGLCAEIPSVCLPEIEIFALSDDDEAAIWCKKLNNIDKSKEKTIFYIVLPWNWIEQVENECFALGFEIL